MGFSCILQALRKVLIEKGHGASRNCLSQRCVIGVYEIYQPNL